MPHRIRTIFTDRDLNIGGTFNCAGVRYTLVEPGSKPTRVALVEEDGAEKSYYVSDNSILDIDGDEVGPEALEELIATLKQRIHAFELYLHETFPGISDNDIHFFERAERLSKRSNEVVPYVTSQIEASGGALTFRDVVTQMFHYNDAQIFASLYLGFTLAQAQDEGNVPLNSHINLLAKLKNSGASKDELIATYHEIKDLNESRVFARFVGFSAGNDVFFEDGTHNMHLKFFQDLRKLKAETTEAQMLELLPQISDFRQETQFEGLKLGLTPDHARLCIRIGDRSLHFDYANRLKNSGCNNAATLNERFAQVARYTNEAQFFGKKLGLDDAAIMGLTEANKFHMIYLMDYAADLPPQGREKMVREEFERIRNMNPAQFLARKLNIFSDAEISGLTPDQHQHMLHLENFKNRNASMAEDELGAMLRARYEEIKRFYNSNQFEALRLGLEPVHAKEFGVMHNMHLTHLHQLQIQNPQLTSEALYGNFLEIKTLAKPLQFRALRIGLLPEDARKFRNHYHEPVITFFQRTNQERAENGQAPLSPEELAEYTNVLLPLAYTLYSQRVSVEERITVFGHEIEAHFPNQTVARTPSPNLAGEVVEETFGVAQDHSTASRSRTPSPPITPTESNQTATELPTATTLSSVASVATPSLHQQVIANDVPAAVVHRGFGQRLTDFFSRCFRR